MEIQARTARLFNDGTTVYQVTISDLQRNTCPVTVELAIWRGEVVTFENEEPTERRPVTQPRQ